MALFFKLKRNKLSTTESIDIIESIVYAELKPLGFRKYGRTLHRFVSGDISQVVNFQSGLPSMGFGGCMWVNIGIRIPECAEQCFAPVVDKKYYHEYQCTLRARLGEVKGKAETCYDLSKNPQKTGRIILNEIKEYVLPAFDVLCDRQAILNHRREYQAFDTFYQRIALDECFIYGRMGDMEKSKECFLAYYLSAIEKYEKDELYGNPMYLRKGEVVMYKKQKIVAEKNGYYTVYGGNSAGIEYLKNLAEALGFEIE